MLKSGSEVRERQITIKIYYLIKSDDDIQSHLSLSRSLWRIGIVCLCKPMKINNGYYYYSYKQKFNCYIFVTHYCPCYVSPFEKLLFFFFFNRVLSLLMTEYDTSIIKVFYT